MDDFSTVSRQEFISSQLKKSFDGVERVNQNYSQALQDIFVLTMLNGKENGVYVEIGGAHPININNTYLLESVFNWSGVSFEINSDLANFYNSERLNKCICYITLHMCKHCSLSIYSSFILCICSPPVLYPV